MKAKKTLSFLTATLLLASIGACSESKPADPNRYEFGEFDVLYKGSCIMYSEYGKESLVMNFDFTNNSKENASYGLKVTEKPVQNGAEMEGTYVVTDWETYASVSENYFIQVEPGNTIEVASSYALNGMDEVTMTLSDAWEKHVYTITVDPSALEIIDNRQNAGSSEETTAAEVTTAETTTTEPSSAEATATEAANAETTTTEATAAETTGENASVEITENQQFSNDAGTSIDVLREEIGGSTAVFGAAYIGCFDRETAEETGIDFNQWFYAASSPLAYHYPFVSEIDEAHTVGDYGEVYCIIAKDYGSSVSVSDPDGNVLYKANNGEPILLLCNESRKMTVTIETADGKAYQWEPATDGNDRPQLLIGDERELLSWDFTETSLPDSGFDLENWLSDGWLGLTAVGLAYDENGTDWGLYSLDNSKSYLFSFYLGKNGDYDGEAVLSCYYENVAGVQAEWQGWWRMETELEQPSRLYLDMMLLNGDDKEAFENAAIITESYQLLAPLSGEYILLVADNENPTLPIFEDGLRSAELSLVYG